jgi:hypothetical protein
MLLSTRLATFTRTAEVFRRPQLVAELAGRLLRPGVLDEGLRPGLFLSVLRRTGKTTFLRTDLLPELEGVRIRQVAQQRLVLPFAQGVRLPQPPQ